MKTPNIYIIFVVKDNIIYSVYTMELIKQYKGQWHLVNSNPNTKAPVNGVCKNGGVYNNLADWNCKKRKTYMKDILPCFTANHRDDLGYGIKLGAQPNGDYVIGLDFDVYGKCGDTIAKCDETQQLYDDFCKINPTHQGIWRSGTEGNYGCLVLVEEPTLIESIEKINLEKHGKGLEMLFNTHYILPPSPSKCKRTQILRNRHLINPNKPIYVLNSKDAVYDFIIAQLPTDIVKPQENSPQKRKMVIKKKKNTELKNETVSLLGTTIEYDPSTIEDEDKELADIIDIADIDYYPSWVTLLWACKEANDFDLAVYLSKRSEKYDNTGLDGVHYKYNSGSRKGISKATFYYYAKKGNPHLYQQIRKKYNGGLLKNTEGDLADLFIDLFAQEHLFYEKNHYFYNGVYWEDNNSGNKLKKSIRTELTRIYADELANVGRDMKEHADDEQIMKTLKDNYTKIKNIIETISSYTRINNIYGFINTGIERGSDEIEWENQPYHFAFKNKIYDLKNNSWTTPLKDDYITITTGYDWREPTDGEMKKLREIIDTILPQKDEQRLYMTILAQAMIGETLEKFIMANGNGGNGKGVINELVYEMFGNYAYNCANNVLLAPLKQGSNPEVANMGYKRIVFYREPEENQKINVATMKELTGGSEINARKNYSNNTSTKLMATHILECNKRLKLSGKVDNALNRRLCDIPFRSTFTNNPEDYGGDYVFKADKYYKTQEFKETYRYALFKILLEYSTAYIADGEVIDKYICPSVVERTQRYLESNDEVKTWFDVRYEKTDDKTAVVQLKELYEQFKESDLWSNMSKREKREMNYKGFIEYMETNLHFRKYYKDRCVAKEICEKYGATQMRNVIVGFIEKEDGLIEECI